MISKSKCEAGIWDLSQRFPTPGWRFVRLHFILILYNRRMPVVSITRLRIRAWRFMPAFAFYAVRSRMQAAKAEGNRGLNLLREPGNIFWTATVWDSEAAVKQFMLAQPHGEAMLRLMHWCDEASVVRWSQDTIELPDWLEAHRRMQSEGRPSKVRFPSAAHHRHEIPPPKR